MAFLAARPMEDFFIHPTLDMETNPSAAVTTDTFGLYDAFPQHKRAAPKYHSGKSTPHSTTMASLKQSASSMTYVPQQPDYFHGYASDEELASPVDDDLSIPSDESVGDAVTPETYIAEAVQQCSRAQAVRIHPVGKPKVIDLPKLDLSYRRTSRPSSSFNEGRRGSRLRSIEESRSNRSSQESHSRNDSLDSSSGNSPASTAPSSVDEQEFAETYNKKSTPRHKPLMEAVKDMNMSPIDGYTIPRSATLPYRRDSMQRYSVDLTDRYNVPASPTGSFRPSIRKMGKFSSIINLNILGRDSKDGYDTQSLYNRDPEAQSVSQKVAPRNVPTRRSSVQQKMVARGANERAPTLRLPSFPGE